MTEDLTLNGKFGANDIEWMCGDRGKGAGEGSGKGGEAWIGGRVGDG